MDEDILIQGGCCGHGHRTILLAGSWTPIPKDLLSWVYPAPLERSSGLVGPPQTQASLKCCFPISFFKDSLQIDFLKCLTICCLPADLQLGQNALSTALPETNCSEIHEMHSFSICWWLLRCHWLTGFSQSQQSMVHVNLHPSILGKCEGSIYTHIYTWACMRKNIIKVPGVHTISSKMQLHG